MINIIRYILYLHYKSNFLCLTDIDSNNALSRALALLPLNSFQFLF